MLQCFTNISIQRAVNMAFHSPHFASFVRSAQTNARPFDEILYSYDLTASSTSNEDFCLNPPSTKDPLT